MTLRLAFSPCPNDTFVFHALVHGLVAEAPEMEVTYADVDVTNAAAERGEFDLAKVSFAALPWLLDQYELLPCGGALGRGCGPLVVVRDSAESTTLTGRTVAVPGDRTTAYLLMRMWSAEHPPARVVVMPFRRIMPAVVAGEVDAGLVIHEARFTYPQYGLRALVDLGEWWEGETDLPIPLGAIVARRDTVDPVAATSWIRDSVRRAWAAPGAGQEYVLTHAQEMDPSVATRHIDLYVNHFTENLGEEGYAAVTALLNRSAAAGLTPPVQVDQISSSRATAWTT